jgi:hypothetical protein
VSSSRLRTSLDCDDLGKPARDRVIGPSAVGGLLGTGNGNRSGAIGSEFRAEELTLTTNGLSYPRADRLDDIFKDRRRATCGPRRPTPRQLTVLLDGLVELEQVLVESNMWATVVVSALRTRSPTLSATGLIRSMPRRSVSRIVRASRGIAARPARRWSLRPLRLSAE